METKGKPMFRVMRWVGYVIGAVLLLAVVLWTVSRSRGPTAEQERALVLMEESRQPQGRNAFAAIWLLPYDVPQAEQRAIVAEDGKRLATLLQAIDAETAQAAAEFESAASSRYEDLSPSAEDRAMFCNAQAGCYEKVAADFDAYLALVERNEVLLARTASLANYDYYKNEFPWHPMSPGAPLDLGRLRLTQHAVQFASGDHEGALDGTCRDIATWRRLGANSDSLLSRMVGNNFSTNAYGQLLAELLDSTPPDITLPHSCAKALAPMAPQEMALCRPLQGEFQLASSTMMDLKVKGSWFNRLLSSLVYDAHMTRAAMAEGFAPSCSAQTLQRIADDQPPAPYTQGQKPWLQCAGNIAGCILSDMGQPVYTGYERRAQDQGARVQLLATMLWLHDSAGNDHEFSLAQRLDLRPAELRSPTRDIEVTEDGKAIRIRQFDTTRGEYWQVPLPKHFRPNERS